MTDNKLFVCPDCGGRLEAWVEEVYEWKSGIDPKTGKIAVRKTRSKTGSTTGNTGIHCKSCHYWVTSFDLPEGFEPVSENMEEFFAEIDGKE